MLANILMTTTEEPIMFIGEIMDNLRDPELWMGVASKLLQALILIIAAMILVRIVNRMIDNFFKVKSKSRLKGSSKRNQTLINVLQNAATVFIWFVVIMMVLETFSLPVRTLLAGAGVVGLAIGFGAQSLVKDMITGFFIILENQFDKGDFVRVNTSGTTVAEGEVLSLGLRASKIQGWEGELFIIPNGTINEVVNFSRYNAISMLDMNVSVEEDLDAVENILEQFFEARWQEEEMLVSKPEILGLQGIENGEAIIRVMLETQPMEHFGVTRRMRKAIKNHLEDKGIYISVPKMDIQDFDDKMAKDEGE
ncbi:mechanosensitive ion channel family protein [Salinicoccus roseus]|uniref:Mechanosensitive ion channel family protein n=2 Tax=Salinicoccus roseus TaxID=45670 RepID=A0ABT4YET9_9STAP|nr:mechanosensitive ion channel family protein [Salinicoccus roseus]MDB0579343.1 mechanosensitive ion channel family protein [Salinicoccus roseus]